MKLSRRWLYLRTWILSLWSLHTQVAMHHIPHCTLKMVGTFTHQGSQVDHWKLRLPLATRKRELLNSIRFSWVTQQIVYFFGRRFALTSSKCLSTMTSCSNQEVSDPRVGRDAGFPEMQIRSAVISTVLPSLAHKEALSSVSIWGGKRNWSLAANRSCLGKTI